MHTETENALTCPNCKRILDRKYFVEHHLVPRQKGGAHMEDNKILLCRPCEKQLHNLSPNSRLKREFNTLEKIINDFEMKKFGEWIGKRNIIRVKHTNKKAFTNDAMAIENMADYSDFQHHAVWYPISWNVLF